jgi:DNA-binding protein H-NS
MSTLNVLEAQLAEIQAQIEKEKGKENAKQQVSDLIKSLGYSFDELYGEQPKASGNKKPRSKSKYQNPENKRQRWNGEGAKPQWVVEFEANGGNLADIPFGK